MRIKGYIHMIELDNNIIGIKCYKHLKFFYMQNGLMNMYKKYLYQFNWIDLEYIDKKIIKGGFSCYKVDFIYQIYGPGVLDKVIYYDKKEVDKATLRFLDKINYTMFLDLEMTMPSYSFSGKEFESEIIQVGYELYYKDNKLINTYENYVKPTLEKFVSSRTLKFLNLTPEVLASSVAYKEFYKPFAKLVKKYHPAIIIYGKNDKLVLDRSFEINKVEYLRIRYVNLLNLIKAFYNLKNDPGLFKLYDVYYKNHEIQLHDALDDSHVTKLVYDAFKEDVKTYKYYDEIRAKFNI